MTWEGERGGFFRLIIIIEKLIRKWEGVGKKCDFKGPKKTCKCESLPPFKSHPNIKVHIRYS